MQVKMFQGIDIGYRVQEGGKETSSFCVPAYGLKGLD